MKIAFFPGGCLPIHANTLNERPLGGLETALIRLAEALRTVGHNVVVLTSLANPPLSDPLYLPISAYQDLGPVDALIAVREWKPLLLRLEAKKRFLWTGDSYDQPQNIGIGDKRVAEAIDWLLPVSNWHGKRLCEESGFPATKVHVLRNGIHSPFFAGTEQRNMNRLIYSSTPYRGLALLPVIFSELKKRHPDLELHVFSGFDVYGGAAGYHQPAVREYAALAERLRELPGCVLRGNIPQQELAREFMRSAVLAYPNTFEETSCITAMEAQAAGCVVVTSDLGALSETVGSAGILIKGKPGSPVYLAQYIEEMDRLLSDRKSWEKLSLTAVKQAVSYDWPSIANDFSDWLSMNC